MIVFENKGELDIRAIKTFGVNSKDNPASAIGYFGTGLKYALAILLRAKHVVTIITGGKKYTFGVVTSKIRNYSFDIVTMNGEELGFTTELGKDWDEIGSLGAIGALGCARCLSLPANARLDRTKNQENVSDIRRLRSSRNYLPTEGGAASEQREPV